MKKLAPPRDPENLTTTTTTTAPSEAPATEPEETAPPAAKSDKRRAVILSALAQIPTRKLREILADRLTLDEALKLAEID